MSDTAVLEPEVEEIEGTEVEETDGEGPTLNIVSTGKVVRPYDITASAFVIGDMLALLTEEAPSTVRNSVAKDINAVYSGTFEGDDTEFTFTPTQKNVQFVLDALRKLGFEFDIQAAPTKEKGSASNGKAKTEKAPTFCLYSGQPTKGGKFRPGYDMKLRGDLTRIVDQAENDEDEYWVGMGTARRKVTRPQAVNELVNVHNWYTSEQIADRVAKADARLAKAEDVEVEDTEVKEVDEGTEEEAE